MMEFETQFADRISRPFSQGELFHELADIAQRVVGYKVMTVLRYERSAGVVRRVWTSVPKEYPAGSCKPITAINEANDVTPIIVRNRAQMISSFADYQDIFNLGCESCFSLPIVVSGRRIGLINLMHEAEFYGTEKIKRADQIRLPGIVCFMSCGWSSETDAGPL